MAWRHIQMCSTPPHLKHVVQHGSTSPLLGQTIFDGLPKGFAGQHGQAQRFPQDTGV